MIYVPDWLQVFFASLLPFFELRLSIPLGVLHLDMPWPEVFLISVIGNIIPVPFILKLFNPVETFLRRWRSWDKLFTWLFARTRRKTEKKIERWEVMGLIMFVAIPLPVTGAWTGSLAAYIFDLDFKKSIFYIFIGIVIAGAIVTTAVAAGINWFL
ncbi:MAG: small multi-drug export protein [Candidatus Thermoplasmatota archaeon]|nr:small multi-drug export protein [Candidatus Thermoplasmatota archaeon]